MRNKVNGTDFINGSWVARRTEVDNYDLARPFAYTPFNEISIIVSQAPLNSTLTGHYELINQEKVEIIISFEPKLKGNKEAIGVVHKIGHVTTKVIHKKVIRNVLSRRQIGVCCIHPDFRYLHRTIEFQVMEPKDLHSTKAIKNFLSAFCLIRKETQKYSSLIKILVHDDASGSGLSGIFILLYEALEVIDKEHFEQNRTGSSPEDNKSLLDVYSMLSNLRDQREKMVQSFSHYKFLHRCIQYYASKMIWR